MLVVRVPEPCRRNSLAPGSSAARYSQVAFDAIVQDPYFQAFVKWACITDNHGRTVSRLTILLGHHGIAKQVVLLEVEPKSRTITLSEKQALLDVAVLDGS